MRNFVITISLFLASTTNAQQWHSDIDQAFSVAAKQQKEVLIYFTVKNCPTCESLEKNVLSTVEFSRWASDNCVLAKMDFTDDATHSVDNIAETLLIVEKYNKDGFFPFIVIANPAGKILNKMEPYNGESAIDYIKLINKR